MSSTCTFPVHAHLKQSPVSRVLLGKAVVVCTPGESGGAVAEEAVRAEEEERQRIAAPGTVGWAAAGEPASHVGTPLHAGHRAYCACAAASGRPRHKNTGGELHIGPPHGRPGSCHSA